MIVLSNLCKSFSNIDNINVLRVLNNISLVVNEGEVVSLVGPSGCGKSTLLKIIDGLIRPTSGSVTFKPSIMGGGDIKRAMIFQDSNLLPWRNVISNVTLGLEFMKVNKNIYLPDAEAFLKLLGIYDFRKYYPQQLSGGMKQRVSIARALVMKPKLLLCDEPFNSVDAFTREKLNQDLLFIIKRDTITTIFVTHNIEEAIYMGDRVVVLSKLPSRLIYNVKINLPEDRTWKTVKFMDIFIKYKKSIWDMLAY